MWTFPVYPLQRGVILLYNLIADLLDLFQNQTFVSFERVKMNVLIKQ